MERIAQSVRREDQEEVNGLILELKKHANY
jgi:hypothetical protein